MKNNKISEKNKKIILTLFSILKESLISANNKQKQGALSQIIELISDISFFVRFVFSCHF